MLYEEGSHRSAKSHSLIHEGEDENYQVKQMETIADVDKTLLVELVAAESLTLAGWVTWMDDPHSHAMSHLYKSLMLDESSAITVWNS